jgi:hypothetical protein
MDTDVAVSAEIVRHRSGFVEVVSEKHLMVFNDREIERAIKRGQSVFRARAAQKKCTGIDRAERDQR